MRGLLLGIGFFFLFIITGIVAIGASTGFSGEVDINLMMQEAPVWTLLSLIGIFGIFLAPIYYWLVEPFLQKRKKEY